MGFVMYPSNPAALARARSSGNACAVSAMTFHERSGKVFSSSSNAYPSPHPQRAAVQLDQSPGKREAQPRPFILPARRRVELGKLLEQLGLILGGNADPRVRHGDPRFGAPPLPLPLSLGAVDGSRCYGDA